MDITVQNAIVPLPVLPPDSSLTVLVLVPELGNDAEVCCRFCRRVFTFAQFSQAHRCKGRPPQAKKVTCRTTPLRKFACEECGKSFTQKISLQYHNIYVHNGERKAACPHCDYKAPDKAKLSVHLKIHSKVRPFICELCGASFKFRSTYRCHVARHTNSGNYVCGQCNKAFMMHSELLEHCRTHAMDRPFVCSICSMTFKQKKRLRIHHRAVHLRDKRYTCVVCGSSHINNWNLQTHMKTHVQADASYSHVCEHCGSTFRGRAGLAAHTRLRHNGESRQPQQQCLQQQYQVVEVLGIAKDEVLGIAKEEAIEHFAETHTDSAELKMIEVYSCSICGQLCDSFDQLTAHSEREHPIVTIPGLV